MIASAIAPHGARFDPALRISITSKAGTSGMPIDPIIDKSLTAIKSHQLTLIQCVFGGMLLFFILPMGPGGISNSQWGWLFVIGAVHTDGVYILLYGALPKLSTPIIAVLLFIYPASAILVDALLYQTTISMAQTLGLALIFISSLGVTLGWGVKRPIVGT